MYVILLTAWTSYFPTISFIVSQGLVSLSMDVGTSLYSSIDHAHSSSCNNFTECAPCTPTDPMQRVFGIIIYYTVFPYNNNIPCNVYIRVAGSKAFCMQSKYNLATMHPYPMHTSCICEVGSTVLNFAWNIMLAGDVGDLISYRKAPEKDDKVRSKPSYIYRFCSRQHLFLNQ